MLVPRINFTLLAPELILTVAGTWALLTSVATRRKKPRSLLDPMYVAAAGCVVAFVSAAQTYASIPVGYHGTLVSGSLAVDGLSLFLKMLCILGTLAGVILTRAYHRRMYNEGELYSLLVFAALAMCLLVSATELVTIYLSLEFLSLVSYVMAGYLKEEPRSNEAAVKYFLYGAVSAGIMLYGMSILYGLTGSTLLSEIAAQTSGGAAGGKAVLLAVAMVATGFLFKIAAVPFHQWSPDIYEGAPTPVAAFLSVAPKMAGFGVLLRVFALLFPTHAPDWVTLMAWLSALSMTVGNLSAIPQRNIKRMLAYSSIAQAGYVMMGVAVAGPATAATGMPAVMVYLGMYLVMNIGAFAVAIAVERLAGSEEIPDYAGLGQRSPWLAWMMVVFLVSLAGLPLTAGFVGKYYLFAAVLRFHELAWLAGVAAANTAISVYYYFNVVRVMFFAPAKQTTPVPQPFGLRLALVVAFIFTLLLGIFPDHLLNLASTSNHVYGGPLPTQSPVAPPPPSSR